MKYLEYLVRANLRALAKHSALVESLLTPAYSLSGLALAAPLMWAPAYLN